MLCLGSHSGPSEHGPFGEPALPQLLLRLCERRLFPAFGSRQLQRVEPGHLDRHSDTLTGRFSKGLLQRLPLFPKQLPAEGVFHQGKIGRALITAIDQLDQVDAALILHHLADRPLPDQLLADLNHRSAEVIVFASRDQPSQVAAGEAGSRML